MKKLVLLFGVAVMAMSASAQIAIEDSKTFDNMYVGINGGVSTKTTGHSWVKDLNSNAGLRIGKWFNPVFGMALDGSTYFRNSAWGPSTKTAVRYINASLIGTVNMSNWLGGYKGEPRTFEVVALYGFGWGHGFGAGDSHLELNDQMTSKAGFDFVFNLGKAKAFQFYIEPTINYAIAGTGYATNSDQVQYNINRSMLQLNAGINYKFKNSNGTHNFKLHNIGDYRSEIDALNAQVNSLREELAQKPKEVVKEVVKEVKVKEPIVQTKEIRIESSLVFVNFAQGKSALTQDAMKALDGIKAGSHVQIVGTASPEGSAELNQKLSQARADVVADYLKNKGVIIDEAVGKGVQGTTSNRLAIVYVK